MGEFSKMQSTLGPHRVLIVESHDLQRFVLCETIKRMGVELVDEAANGVLALERCKHQSYDLVICDLKMPEMDGIELLKHLACLDQLPSIIFFSALPSDILDGAQRVAAHYDLPVIGTLGKPFSAARLRELWSAIPQEPIGVSVSQHLPEYRFSVQELLRALHQGNIYPWYQPQIDPHRHCVVGVEALARWDHPHLGLLESSAFLPSVEHHHLDMQLFSIIYQNTIDDYRQWHLQQNNLALKMSINISARHFCDPNLPDQLRAPLDLAGLTPDKFTLELTETQFLASVHHALENVLRLRLLGFNVSLDDFGAGYAGLQYLRELPVNAIKIDRSLIERAASDVAAENILTSAITLARTQHIGVLAEGVSQVEDYQLLVRLGVDLVQGFLLGRPMPADEVPCFLEAYCGVADT